jgi:hypothetical protein
MVGFHGLAYLLFSHAAALVFKHKAVPFITIIFFLNPVVATYFQYPFYCTYLFVAACAVLYFLARQTPALAAGTLLLAGILRTTFALPFGLALLVPFVGQVKKLRHWLIIGLCALPSLFWAVKNQYLFHQFGPSTWMGINLANGGYITYAQGQYPAINKPFDYDARPAAFINQKLDSAYNDVPYLHGPHFNNINTIYTSSYFSAEAKKQFSIGKTLYIMAFGVLQYLESPLDYPLLRPFAGGPKTGIRNSVFPFDYFNLPNIPIPVSGGLLDIHLSLYTFIYPLCFLFGLYYALKNRDYKLGTVLWLLLVVSGIYCSIDPSESNRMRMEIEPLWWWLVLTVLAYYTKRGTPTVA